MDPEIRAVRQTTGGCKYWLFEWNGEKGRWEIIPHPFNDPDTTIPIDDGWVYQERHGKTGHWATPADAVIHPMEETPTLMTDVPQH
jgi:hypothetical protein